MGRPHKRGAWLRCAFLLALGSVLLPPAPRAADETGGRKIPEFPRREPAHWINSMPLTLSSLRGEVVVLEIWTFG